jgi:cytochrome c553
MKRAIIIATVLCGLSSLAVAAGDADKGQSQAAVCGACHGQDGNSPAAAFPKLAGQNQRYLFKQMQDIKSGLRPVAQMTGQTGCDV